MDEKKKPKVGIVMGLADDAGPPSSSEPEASEADDAIDEFTDAVKQDDRELAREAFKRACLACAEESRPKADIGMD